MNVINTSGDSLTIEPVIAADVGALTAVMTRAFDDDARRHQGHEKGGPPGYDTGEFIRTWALHRDARSYKALVDGRIAGCVIAFPGWDGHHRIGNLFTDPEFQRRGIGKALMDHVERLYPGKSWSLETPSFALSNHRFYGDKCGYEKVGEMMGDEGFTEFCFRKLCYSNT